MLSSWLFLPIALFAAAPPGPMRAQLPEDVPFGALLELTQHGEVAFLPRPQSQPFNAVVLTRSASSCAHVAMEMMDIPSWPKRWNIKEATVLERTPRRVRYEIAFDMPLSPTVPGLIEYPDDRHVVFNDVETGAKFIWTLDALPTTSGGGGAAGCAMRYSLLETPGKASGWVAIIKALEPSAVDAGNFAAAFSSARGFAQAPNAKATPSPDAHAAFALLARHGTALRVVRAPSGVSTVVVRRTVDKKPSDVAWAIRDKKRYPERVDAIARVKDRGLTAEYSVGAFGGRVGFQVAVKEHGDASTAEGLTITETVTGGDIANGSWTWRVRPVAGGSDVELTWSADVVEGSAVLRTLARTDPVARESLGLHMALSFIHNLVGGKPLRGASLAQAP